MLAPPVLTPERIDAMLSIVAEVCLESVVEAGQRQKAASDDEGFERCGRTLQIACRNLRQTIAMKQRHDREQERRADDGRKRAEAQRLDAEQSHRRVVEARRSAVHARIDRLIWDEYEQDDALEFSEVAEERLNFLVDDPDFLDAPLATLVQRLADEIGLNDEPQDEPTSEAPPPQAPSSHRGERRDHAEDAESQQAHEPSALSAPSSAISAVESDGSAVPTVAGPPPPDPPPRPPDPEPYIPPWERLKPGQSLNGGGW